MGSGRKAKPTALKALEGTNRKDRVLENEVAYPLVDKLPETPEHLQDRAKKEWEKIVKSLDAIGILTEQDLTVLESYCFNVGLMEQAMIAINEEGAIGIQTNNAGAVYSAENKWVNVYNKAVDRIIKIASEYGFTPSSRTRISMPGKQRKDPFSEFG